MWVNVNDYFRAGGRICLVGAFALHDTRERFFSAIAGYFIRWIDALRSALMRAGCADAQTLAEEGVCGIQGALVLIART